VTGWVNAEGAPGEVVLARVSNPLENARAEGKVRPVVLIRRDGCRWWVMGLTTLQRYASGQPRTPVPNPLSVGLARRGYLWGDRLTGISVMDVDRHLGWVDAALAAAVIVQARLGAHDAAALIRAVQSGGVAA
jgi:hypothetical protein